MPTDFFTRYAVVIAFIGLGLFTLFIFICLALYPFEWNPIDNAFSDMGRILSGNLVAGFFTVSLTFGAASWMPITLVYLREIVKNWREFRQYWGFIGFTLQAIGCIFAILICAFPMVPWLVIHDLFAAMWLISEVLGLMFVAIEMLRGKKDRTCGIIPFVIIPVGICFWVPYFLEIWTGLAIPEFISITIIYSYSMALWVRAWRGQSAIGKAMQ